MERYHVTWEGQADESFKTFSLDEFFTHWVSGEECEPFESYTDFKKALDHFKAKAKKDGNEILIENLNGTTYTLTPTEDEIKDY